MKMKTWMSIITISSIIVFPMIAIVVLVLIICAVAVSGWK